MHAGLQLRLAALVASSALCLQAHAASITVENYTGNSGRTTPFIELVGDLVSTDAIDFERAARQAGPGAIVQFDSPGGDLEAGIAIGRSIHEKGYGTLVVKTCASACALAWLAGKPKFVFSSARIGFHVAYTGGELKQESGLGNALVGLYLGEIGMRENVVRYVTSAAPDDMQWMSARDASLLGIDAQTLDDNNSAATASAPAASPLPSETLPDASAPTPDVFVGLDPANINRAVANARKRYLKAGLVGLMESSAACWQVVAEKRTLDKVQYCRALDVVGLVFHDAEVKKRGARAALPFYESDRRTHAVVEGLVIAGVTDPNTALKLDGMWIKQIQVAAELVGGR